MIDFISFFCLFFDLHYYQLALIYLKFYIFIFINMAKAPESIDADNDIKSVGLAFFNAIHEEISSEFLPKGDSVSMKNTSLLCCDFRSTYDLLLDSEK